MTDVQSLQRLLRLGVPRAMVEAKAAAAGVALPPPAAQAPAEDDGRIEAYRAELARLQRARAIDEATAARLAAALASPAAASDVGRALYQLTQDAKRRGLFRRLERDEAAADDRAVAWIEAALERHELDGLQVCVQAGEVRLSGYAQRDLAGFIAEAEAELGRPVKNFAARVDRAPARAKYGVRDDEITEFFDSDEEVDRKVDRLAELVRAARAAVAYTGAGISTAGGIADFRGPDGCWTRSDRNQPPPASVSLEAAAPTLTHRVLAAMVRRGELAGVVSQNVDGLHMRSGIPSSQLAEMHGNGFVEQCDACGERFVRDFDVTSHRGAGVGAMSMHSTGRQCTACGSGGLSDTIVNFGESVRDLPLAAALADSATLAICLGTSMRVSPACDLPLQVKRPGVLLGDAGCCGPAGRARGGALVIINLQATPADDRADLVIHARTDDVMRRLAQRLALDPRKELAYRPRKAFVVRSHAREVRKAGKVSLSPAAADVLDGLLRRVAPEPEPEPEPELQRASFELFVAVSGECGCPVDEFLDRVEVVLPREWVHAQRPTEHERVTEDAANCSVALAPAGDLQMRRWLPSAPDVVHGTVRLHFAAPLFEHEVVDVPVSFCFSSPPGSPGSPGDESPVDAAAGPVEHEEVVQVEFAAR